MSGRNLAVNGISTSLIYVAKQMMPQSLVMTVSVNQVLQMYVYSLTLAHWHVADELTSQITKISLHVATKNTVCLWMRLSMYLSCEVKG